MIDTGCQHPESEIVVIQWDLVFVQWCPICGSINDNNGDHGAAPCSWRAPAGIVLPGWTCGRCEIFNGAGKELLNECRHCGAKEKR